MTNPKQLRIALFTDDFYPASGGVTRSMQTQISELVRSGHIVTLFAPQHFLEKPDGCTTVIVPSFYISGTPAHMCILKHGKRLAQQLSDTYKFDIIHSQTDRGGLILAARIAHLQHVPHIHTFHTNLAGTHASQPLASFWGSMAYLFLINGKITRVSPRRVAEPAAALPKNVDSSNLFSRLDWGSLATIALHVDGVTTPSKFMMKYIQIGAKQQIPLGRVIPNGYSRQLEETIMSIPRNNDASRLRFISIGRLSREKRVKEIILAFMKANIKNSELVIIGKGDQLQSLKALAKGNKSIIFKGHITSQETIAQELSKADVLVLASYHFDTQAIVIAEAAIAGLPIIYCDERLDAGLSPLNSILTASPEIGDITAAMIKITDTKLRETLSNSSRREAARLSPEHMSAAYLALYQKAIEQTSH